MSWEYNLVVIIALIAETQGFITNKRLHGHETMPRENIKTAEELAEVGDCDTVAVAAAASRVQEGEDEDN